MVAVAADSVLIGRVMATKEAVEETTEAVVETTEAVVETTVVVDEEETIVATAIEIGITDKIINSRIITEGSRRMRKTLIIILIKGKAVGI